MNVIVERLLELASWEDFIVFPTEDDGTSVIDLWGNIRTDVSLDSIDTVGPDNEEFSFDRAVRETTVTGLSEICRWSGRLDNDVASVDHVLEGRNEGVISSIVGGEVVSVVVVSEDEENTVELRAEVSKKVRFEASSVWIKNLLLEVASAEFLVVFRTKDGKNWAV